MTDIQIEYLPAENPGYKFIFHFSENEFFADSTLTKTYHYQVCFSGLPMPFVHLTGYFRTKLTTLVTTSTRQHKAARLIGRKIKTSHKALRSENSATRVRRSRCLTACSNDPQTDTNRTRTIKKAVATPSFFDFFNPPVQPDPHQTFSPEALEALEDRLERDYQVGEDLKDEVIPRAIDYFTGKALDYNGDSQDDLEEGMEEWDVRLYH